MNRLIIKSKFKIHNQYQSIQIPSKISICWGKKIKIKSWTITFFGMFSVKGYCLGRRRFFCSWQKRAKIDTVKNGYSASITSRKILLNASCGFFSYLYIDMTDQPTNGADNAPIIEALDRRIPIYWFYSSVIWQAPWVVLFWHIHRIYVDIYPHANETCRSQRERDILLQNSIEPQKQVYQIKK